MQLKIERMIKIWIFVKMAASLKETFYFFCKNIHSTEWRKKSKLFWKNLSFCNDSTNVTKKVVWKLQVGRFSRFKRQKH